MGAREIVAALHGRWFGSYGTVRCVCHDDRSPSLKLSDGDNGTLLVFCFAGCGYREILTELRRRNLLSVRSSDTSRDSERSARVGRAADESRSRREDAARRIWQEARPAPCTLVETYLRRRGITLPIPPSIRFHPHLAHLEPGAAGPAMVAGVEMCPGGEITGVHRTYLAGDGSGKAFGADSKLSLGSISGGTVRLAPAAEEMAIGEGIETCLSYQQISDIATWAALSTSGMRNIILPAPPLASTVYLLMDIDVSGAGEAAVNNTATRLHQQGRAVKIVRPTIGKDFNDAIRGETYV
jgi:hypothetical protein